MSSRKKPVLEHLDGDLFYEAGKNLAELASTDPVPAKKKPKPAPQALVGGMGQYPATKTK